MTVEPRVRVTVSEASHLPPYEQIRAQLAAAITSGAVAAGTRLPTVRALAEQLGIAANTVARSYRELEAAGMVRTAGRAGTVVSAVGGASHQRLVEAAQEYAALARAVGVDSDSATRIVNAALAGI